MVMLLSKCKAHSPTVIGWSHCVYAHVQVLVGQHEITLQKNQSLLGFCFFKEWCEFRDVLYVENDTCSACSVPISISISEF